MALPPSAPRYLAAYTSGSGVTRWAGGSARWKRFARKQSLLQPVACGEDQPPFSHRLRLGQLQGAPHLGTQPPRSRCTRDSSGKAAAVISGLSPIARLLLTSHARARVGEREGESSGLPLARAGTPELVAGEEATCSPHLPLCRGRRSQRIPALEGASLILSFSSTGEELRSPWHWETVV